MEFLIKFLILTLIFLFLIFIVVFSLYFFFIAFSSRKRCQYVRHGKYSVANYYNNLIVVVYAQNNEKEVTALLESLNRQNYPKENYKTYIILDNCTDNSSNMLEMIGGANIFRVGDSYTVGKDESISQLLDRLLNFKNIDAYVFLDVNRSIDENFLNSVNQGLVYHDVLVGSTVLTGNMTSLKDKVLNAYNIYENNIIKTSRSMMGLVTTINSDVCVIRQDVIEKVQCIDFKDNNTEFKYSLMLAKLNYKSSFDPNIVTYLDRSKFVIKKPSFSYRISLLSNSLSVFLKSNFMFCEYAMSAIQPSVIVLMLFLAFFTWIISAFEFGMPFALMFNSKVLYSIIGILLFSVLFTFKNSTLTLKEMGFLCLYPIHSLFRLLGKLPIIKQICEFIYKKQHPKMFETFTVPVVVGAGNKVMNCEIELIKEDGMIRAVFVFKNKKQSSDLYLRIYDAIKSISDMLAQKEYEIVDPNTKEIVEKGNFDLRICQNCKYFTSKLDGTINAIKGACSCHCNENPQNVEQVLLWQSCENYVSSKEKIVDMNKFRK